THLPARQVKIITIIVFCLLVILSLRLSVSDSPLKDGQSLQVNTAERVAEEIIKHVGDKPFNFALITPANSDHAYRYFLDIKGYKPAVLENTVTDQLIVLCEQEKCSPLGHSLWEISGFGRAEIVEEFTAAIFPAYLLKHYQPTPP
ncbi:MAG: hypothetical protein AAB724_03215, partial [Patescibacteria group bacterium]